MTCNRAALLVPLLLAGCTEQLPPGPRPEAVAPAEGPNTAALSVTITGSNFEPHVVVDYDEADRSRVDDHFTARLDQSHALEQVRWRDNTRLEAVVPAGLPPGTYALTVTDPRGDSGTLESAFTVLGPVDAGVDADGPAADGPAADGPGTDGPAADGATDSKPPPDSAPTPDAPPPKYDLGPCPAVCSSCNGSVCNLPCENGCTCPPNWSCAIDCWAKICSGNIDCSAARDCDLKCASTSCTGKVTCGSGHCEVSCASGSCLGGVDCSQSCACSVSCASGACGPGVTCPPTCNKKCAAADNCDSCP